MSKTRPKLGLALSGGGACGLAHVGLLKVMEEEGLRPDYIAGVSMGSLIGALYSAGYSADTIQILCETIDWNLVVGNKIPENKIIFNEKDHFYNSIVSLPLTLKKMKLPSGLINGQQIENALNYYFWPVLQTNDFLKLPIPFMCLAVDLFSGTRVELSEGYLPDALRASTAVPYIFTPLKADTMLLADGGVLRNFPAAEVRDMGADIIIGCYTGSRFRNENELETVTEILAQLGFLSSILDFDHEKKLVNYLIEPYTDDIDATSFESYDTLIMRGYRAAEPFRMKFRRLADSLNSLGVQNTARGSLIPHSYKFDIIKVKGNNIYSDVQIKGVLDISPGEPVTRDMISDKIDLLYGKNWFEKVKYRVIREKDSLTLEIECQEKPRSMLYGAVHYDNALRAGLVLGLSVRNPILRGSQIELNSLIGEAYRVNFIFQQFIDRNQKYNLSAGIYADNTLIPKMELDGRAENTMSRNLYSGLTLGRRLGLNNLLSLTGRIENTALSRDDESGDSKEKFRLDYGSAEFVYKSNTLNSKHFPDRGVKTELSVRSSLLLSADHISDTTVILYTSEDGNKNDAKLFYTFHGRYSQYFTKLKKWTMNLSGEILYITATDSISSMNNQYFLGGFESVSPRSVSAIGFHPLQIGITRMASAHIEIDFEVIEKLHLNLTGGISVIKDPKGNNGISFLPGIALGAGYMSIIGPIRSGIMYGIYNNEKYFNRFKGYISVGYNF